MKAITSFLALVLTVGTVMAQQPQPAKGAPPAGARLEALKSYLQLSDRQVQDITAQLAAFRDSVKPIREEMMAKRKDLRAEMSKSSPDATVATKLKNDLKDLQSQVSSKRDELKPQLLAILNDSQKESLASLEQALKVRQAANQAAALGLIDAPQGNLGNMEGFGGPAAGRMPKGMGRP
jgi:chromosome segregation ATPase